MSENIVHIMTANQARESTEKSIKEFYESHLPKIMYAIKNTIERAISEFKYSCIIDNHTFAFGIPVCMVYENTHQILEGLGYRVKYHSTFDYMSIDWSKIS